MRLFPAFMDLQDRCIVVVGGGQVALRKVQLLLSASGQVTVVAPSLCAELQTLAGSGSLCHMRQEYRSACLTGQALAIAATNDRGINAQVSRDAQCRNIWVNVVDDPALSSFQVPSIVDRSPLVIAVSTGGVAPVLARRVRERLESLFDHGWGTLALVAERYRSRIRDRYPDVSRRRLFYDWMMDGPVAEHSYADRVDKAERLLAAALDAADVPQAGAVSFVGAGPGDPGLFTLKGLRALNEADVVIHEAGVNSDIVAMSRRDAVKRQMVLPPCGDDPGAGHATFVYVARQAHAGRRVVCLAEGSDGDRFVGCMAELEGQGVRAHWLAGVPAGLLPSSN